MTVYIKYFVSGKVPSNFINRVLNIVSNFISVVEGVEYLEIYFYGSSREKLWFLESEALELGVIVIGDFMAMHEAWRGWPRIHIDYEKCSSLSEKHLKAIVIHEASHAVLHGSLQYYILRLDLNRFRQLNPDEIIKLLYVVSTIVKDIDVYELLTKIGMIDVIHDYIDFLADQYKDIECRSLDEYLHLMKILPPCLYTERCYNLDQLSKECREKAEKLLNVLNRFRRNRVGDISRDIELLMEQIMLFQDL